VCRLEFSRIGIQPSAYSAARPGRNQGRILTNVEIPDPDGLLRPSRSQLSSREFCVLAIRGSAARLARGGALFGGVAWCGSPGARTTPRRFRSFSAFCGSFNVNTILFVTLLWPALYAGRIMARTTPLRIVRRLLIFSAVSAAIIPLLPGSAAQRQAQALAAHFFAVLIPLTLVIVVCTKRSPSITNSQAGALAAVTEPVAIRPVDHGLGEFQWRETSLT
jgi:hypothetical protein